MARPANRPLLLLVNSDDDVKSAERLLTCRVLRLGTIEYADAARVVPIRGVTELRKWQRSSRTSKKNVFVALKSEFDLHQQSKAVLASMNVQLPNLLSAGQDQVFVLDRDQRMVAFVGRWPEDAPWPIKDLLGKRKHDLFGPEGAAVHDAAIARALDGEESAYEWTVTKTPEPHYLFTAASPLRDTRHEVAGVLLVTRNVTPLKREQFELERALEKKTRQLLDIELGVKQMAATLQSPPREDGEERLKKLSKRENEVLNLLRRGVRVRSVARTLGLSVETVRRHVKAMFRKTGVHSQEALVRLVSDW